MPLRWETWSLFLVTETVLCLTPGPAVLLVLSQGLSRGALASIWSNLGILAGNGFYFLLSATGLGAIVRRPTTSSPPCAGWERRTWCGSA